MNKYVGFLEWEIRESQQRAQFFLSQCVEEQSSFFYQEWRAAKARTEALTFALAQYKVLLGVDDAVQSTSI